ncbi:MAG: glycerol-3-phosphate 1-O-acyltransferase PlsY [Candidatus Bipolaricaulia bacterium]
MKPLEGLLAAALFYLLGALPFSYLLGRLVKGIDLREHGSGNVGATNVGRVLGWRYYPLALALDLGKGVAAAMLARHWGLPLELSGFAVLGHDWSLFLRFTGGKGVSTSLGILAVLSWPAFLSAIAVWGLILGTTRFASVASLCALASSPLLVFFLSHDLGGVALMGALALLSIWRHRRNIVQLSRGEEERLSSKSRSSSSSRRRQG